MTTRFDSHVALAEEVRGSLVEQLNKCLASAIDLYSQTKQAHWNVRGPQFIALHELFDQVADHLRETADDFAERAGALGGYAEGTVRMASTNSVLPDYEKQAVDGQQHIKALVDRFSTYTGFLRQAAADAASNDSATEDLLIEALRTAEKDLWFLESHLEPNRS